MRLRLWSQIGLTLAVNFGGLLLLAALFLLQQNRGGLDSVLYAPARERIREIGSRVAAEFPAMPDAERNAFLYRLQQPYNVTIAVYDDTGRLVAGPDLPVPADVMKEVRRSQAERPRVRQRGAPRPIFLVREASPSRYWAGYHFPIVEREGHPPVRHTVLLVTSSLLSSPLFIDWKPWLLGGSLALLVTALCWIPLVRHLTRSITRMRGAAADIAEGHFHVDIPNGGGDELGELGASIARMAQQLAHLVHGQRRFLADVAHELCAPLSRIQLSVGILEERAGAAEKETVRRLDRDVTHMSALVSDLLAFTKGASRRPEIVSVPLAALVEETVQRESCPVDVPVEVEIDPAIAVLADPEHLERALSNVLRNAALYAGNAGPIRVHAAREAGMAILTIHDCGPGLPSNELEAVFQPFYRPDTVRTPGDAGFGLGLAIVKSSIEACGGTVRCANRKPTGLTVTIELRLA